MEPSTFTPSIKPFWIHEGELSGTNPDSEPPRHYRGKSFLAAYERNETPGDDNRKRSTEYIPERTRADEQARGTRHEGHRHHVDASPPKTTQLIGALLADAWYPDRLKVPLRHIHIRFLVASMNRAKPERRRHH
jgi:hypothetical protein